MTSIVRRAHYAPLVTDRLEVSAGELFGDGVFETVHLRPAGPWLLAEHLDRLERSAARLGARFSWSVSAARHALLYRQGLEAARSAQPDLVAID